MGWLGDTFLGSRPDYGYMPGVADMMDKWRNYTTTPGAALRSSKKLLRSLDAGEDVSNIGTFAPLQQDEAADLSDIDFDYMTGANALIGAQGGDQMNQVNRMRDLTKERRRADTGRQMTRMIPALRQQAMDVIDRNIARREGNELSAGELMARLNEQQYDRRRKGGILPDILKGAIGGLASWGMGFLPKPAAAAA